MRITTVGLDADDTLWHNETIFRLTHDRFQALMADVVEAPVLDARLAEIEKRNLSIYGYGVKGFTLSMLETAMEITGNECPPRIVAELLAVCREMLAHPVEPLSGVDVALSELSERYRLVLITKGDLLHQEQKLAASGLGDHFAAVEIVSEKTADTYARVFARHGTGAGEAAMCGNSMKSDVLPALQAGAFAAYVPYPLIWAHEVADAPDGHPRYAELKTIADLPGWLASLD
jgi:putative hydrolase of the HAD superfamily